MNKKITIDIVIPVFEEQDHLQKIVELLNIQLLPTDYQLKIIIVDDASTDGTADYIQKTLVSDTVSLIGLDSNSGPAVARNKGCFAGGGEILILIDADCIPNTPHFIAEHIKSLKNHDISCGGLLGKSPESQFWGRYQKEIFDNRVKAYRKNKKPLFTTSNLAFTRKHFEKVNGFDESYYFGFEDRDFLLRSQEHNAKVIYTEKACVTHSDQLSMVSVCRKMRRAGEVESGIFQKRHPIAYKEMPYAKIDVRQHVFLRPIAIYIAPIVCKSTVKVDYALEVTWLPYNLKKLLVKSMSAFCFMNGTAKKEIKPL